MNPKRLFPTSATACMCMIGFPMSLMCVSLVFSWLASRTVIIRSDVSQLTRKLWLESILNNSDPARLVQDIIGEKASQNLLARFNERAKTRICRSPSGQPSSQLPTIYVITPTYRRPEQLADLTRLGQTLMHVEKLIWIIVEEANTTSPIITEFLTRTGIKYVHLITGPMLGYSGEKPKGVINRRKGIHWILQNATEGVMYFGDDDNTYSIDLFDENVNFRLNITVAIQVKSLFQRPKVKMAFIRGYEEDSFLKSLEPLEPREIELRASNCTKILIWHTRTETNGPAMKIDHKKYNQTNLMELEKYLV